MTSDSHQSIIIFISLTFFCAIYNEYLKCKSAKTLPTKFTDIKSIQLNSLIIFWSNRVYSLHFKNSYLSIVVRKLDFCLCENKGADQLPSNCETDQHRCFRYMDSTISLFLNPKFQASSHLLCLYSSVCVEPGRKPRRPVFLHRSSFYLGKYWHLHYPHILSCIVKSVSWILDQLPLKRDCHGTKNYSYRYFYIYLF